METSHKVSIFIGILGLIGMIGAAIIGVVWGKNNVSIIVQSDGKNVEINNDNAQEIISENTSLKEELEELQNENDGLKKEIDDIENNLLSEIPTIIYQDLGLSVDGEEKNITKEKSSASINGKQYYSKEIIDNLLPDDKYSTIENGTFFIGKIIKEKISLFDVPIIKEETNCVFRDSIKDTYGNLYGKSLLFGQTDETTIFNAGRDYSYLKCTVAMMEKHDEVGYLQIITDGNVIYTSPEITNITEPFEVDIPIEQTSIISISTIGERHNNSYIFISNAVLYNQE